MASSKYSLKDIVRYFLRLGAVGFGGPIALVGHMHTDLVENNGWLTEEEYKEGLALAQLAPGPLAAQLGIYIGFVHYGLLGATLVGISFVLPSFILVLGLGFFYKLYGGIDWVREAFYGIGAAVVAIIAVSAYRLTVKSVSKLNIQSIKSSLLLWIFYLLAIVITMITQQEQVGVFIGCGLLYMVIKAPPKWLVKRNGGTIIIASGFGILNFTSNKSVELGIFFLKAGTFVFGSGLAIVPFLHSGVVNDNHWLSESQFLDAVAVAMITPGPVVITVGFIGYLVDGFSGASIAAFATFLPCFLFTIILAPFFKKIAKNLSVKAFVDGITAAVIGALVGSVLVIAGRTIIDIPTLFIAISSGVLIVLQKNIREPYLIVGAALFGILIRSI